MPQRRARLDADLDKAADILRTYLNNGASRTDLLKECAKVIVTIRARYSLEDGRPDWGGRSPEYRKAISRVYDDAGVPQERLDTVQAALRYHVGNLLRATVPAEELAAVGLSSTSPKDRLSRQRETGYVLGKAAAEGPLAVLIYAEALLTRVDKKAAALMDREEADAARIAVEGIRRTCSEIIRILPSVPV